MTIDPRAGVPLRIQLASILRERIRRGELAPGQAAPSGPQLADDFGVSRYTADRALDLLASEGLVERVTGIGTIVRAGIAPAEVVWIGPGARVSARMPTGTERGGLPPGVPVLVIETPGGATQVLAADRTVAEVRS